MTTAADALHAAHASLADAGVDTPRLDAQLLLAWVLHARREDLARDPLRVLTARENLIYAKAVSLRVLRRPLPYITGRAWFYGREFKVNRAVLIPRPETEDVVTAALSTLTGVPNPVCADIGTGSGCIAVTLACERPDAHVWATDLSPLALLVAHKNATRHGVAARVSLSAGDLLSALPPQQFDVLMSNPPYVSVDDTNLPPEVRDYEPGLALTGDGAAGTDGTGLHRRLLLSAPPFLRAGAWLVLEVGQGQADAVCGFARERGYADVHARPDLAGIARVVMARRGRITP